MTVTSMRIDKPAGGRWLSMALLASLAVNLVLVGATGGFLWRYGQELLGGAPAHFVPNLLNYTTTLPETRRKQLWNRTEEARDIMQPLRGDLRAARNETLKILAADTFDRQEYEAAQSRLLAVDRKAREAIYRLYGEIAANLTPEERRGFIAWREKQRPRRNLLDEPQK
jgi:uncharacterized membrane protein